jgi:hypothetical protein
MSSSFWKLTPEQVAMGRALRDRGATWYATAKEVMCSPETIRRALDPDYDLHRAAIYAQRTQRRRDARGPRPPKPPKAPKVRLPRERKRYERRDEAELDRLRTIACDMAFCAAMRTVLTGDAR